MQLSMIGPKIKTLGALHQKLPHSIHSKLRMFGSCQGDNICHNEHTLEVQQWDGKEED